MAVSAPFVRVGVSDLQ